MTLFSFVNDLQFSARKLSILGTGEAMTFFLEITSASMTSDANPSNFVVITSET